MSPVHIGLLGVVLLFLIAMIEIGIIESAYQKLGMSHRAVTLLLLLSIFGSYINIPVATISSPPVIHHHHIYNLSYIPALLPNPDDTIIAVNLGGAVIPVLLSAYLLLRVGRAVKQFFDWCEDHHLALEDIEPIAIAAYIEELGILVSRRTSPQNTQTSSRSFSASFSQRQKSTTSCRLTTGVPSVLCRHWRVGLRSCGGGLR